MYVMVGIDVDRLQGIDSDVDFARKYMQKCRTFIFSLLGFFASWCLFFPILPTLVYQCLLVSSLISYVICFFAFLPLSLAEQLLTDECVFVIPGSCFRMKNFFRVVFSAPIPKLVEAYARIKTFVDSKLLPEQPTKRQKLN